MVPTNLDKDYHGFSLYTYHVLVAVVVIALALLVWRIADAILLAFVGILLAAALRGLARLLGRYLLIPTEWALPLVAFVLAAAVVLFVWIAGPRINEQLGQFSTTLPNAIAQVEQWLKTSSWGQYILDQLGATQLSGPQGLHLFSQVTGIASAVITVIANIVIVVFTAVYFSVNPDLYRRGIVSLVPKSKSQRATEVLDATARMLQLWLLGQGLSMLSVGILVTAAMFIVGVPLAFLLGVIAGLLEFIPFIGPITAAIPGVLMALTQGWHTALYAVAAYFIVGQIEGQVIVPLIQRKAVELPPALIVLAVIAMGLIFGVLGAIIATPLMAVVMVWVKMLYVQDVLGKSIEVK